MDLKQESEGNTEGHLIDMCDQLGLDHTGDREALTARLVAFHKAKATEPEVEPESEPVVEPPEPEVEPVVEPVVEPEPEAEPED